MWEIIGYILLGILIVSVALFLVGLFIGLNISSISVGAYGGRWAGIVSSIKDYVKTVKQTIKNPLMLGLTYFCMAIGFLAAIFFLPMIIMLSLLIG